MKHKLLSALGLIVLVMVAFATSPAEAQTTAPGPYYATPSWDQTLPCTTTANCPRFIVLSNMSSAAVLDRETGLVWEKSPSTSTFSWYNAQFHCNGLTVGNRKGWRLPTNQELASLVDLSVAPPGPTLPAGHPFSNVQSSNYWSATTVAIDASNAWDVDFANGFVVVDGKSNNVDFFVWCVRGGQGVNPQ
jgi:hypothetical protein